MVQLLNFIRVCSFILLTVVALAPRASHCETLFEGYYKIYSVGQHIGFLIHRYEVDPKANTMTSIYYLQTGAKGNNQTESVKATTLNTFQPVSYQYTSKNPSGLKLIDASFKNGIMKYTISNGSNKKSGTENIGSKVFLSTFVGYLMLGQGYEVGKNFSYKAVAEEDAKVQTGSAHIQKKIKVKGMDVFEVKNTFKNTVFISHIFAQQGKGQEKKYEVIATHSPVLKIRTELVKTPAEATRGFKLPTKTLKVLFGNIPKGTKNVLHIGSGSSDNTNKVPLAPTDKSTKGKSK